MARLAAAIWLPMAALAAALAANALVPPAAAQPMAEETGRIVWRSGAPGFGGLSGLEISADGRRIAAVSDLGHLLRTELHRDGDRLAGVSPARIWPLTGPDGAVLPSLRSNAEALAGEPDGVLFVALEGEHRVARIAPGTARLDPIPGHPDFPGLQRNSGLEVLAEAPGGGLLAVPERSGALERPFPVYRFDGGTWRRQGEIPRVPPHLPVGADLGPDGRLYLLERHFTGLGFAIRIRSFAALPGGGFGEARIHLQSPVGRYDNLEGLAAWRDAEGAVRLLAVSDDNRHFLQRTELVEFRLPAPGGAPGAAPRPDPRPSHLRPSH